MKLLIYFFAFLFFGCLYSQEPPVFFKIDVTDLVGVSNNSVEKFYMNYEVGGLYPHDKYSNELLDSYTLNSKHGLSIEGKDHWEINFDNDLFIPIFHFIDENEIFSLHIKEKKTNKIMHLFFRTEISLGENDCIDLKDLKFQEGSFFFDTCKAKKKFQKDLLYKHSLNELIWTNDFSLNFRFSLKNLKKHKTTLKCIQRITKKYKCGQESPIKSNKL